MAEQKVKLTQLPEATDTVDTAVLLVNQNETDQRLPITHFLRSKNNLSELENTAQARANLGVPSVEDVNDKVEYLIDGKSTFLNGATLESERDFIWDDNSKNWYYWTGAFSKEVPAASNPDSTGGIGAGAWLSVGDATVRNWVKSNIGLSDTMDELISNLNTVGAAIIHGTHEVPSTGLPVPRECVLSATGQAISAAGNIKKNRGEFHKTGNATIFLEPVSGGSPNATVDAVIYLDPKRTPDNIYAQKSTLENIAIQGDETSPNEYGLYILQGGLNTFRNIDVFGCKYGFSATDLWLTTIERLATDGAIQQLGGTSTTYIGCAAKGNSSVRGAWHIEDLNYSNIIGCASDLAPDGAYYFKNTNAVTISGSGAEMASVASEKTGLALTFDSGCNMIVDGFVYRPRANDTNPLIVAGDNNHIKINNFVSNVGVSYTSADVYLHGNGTIIEFSQSRFRLAKTKPVVHIDPGCSGKVVVKLEGGNVAVYSAGASKESPTVEYMFSSGSFNPTLEIGGSTGGIVYSSRSGMWVKNGASMTVHISVSLSSKGSVTGNVSIGLPFNIPAHTGASICSYSGVTAGPLIAGSVVSGFSLPIRKAGSTATVVLTNSDINDSFSIDLTYTCRIDSLFDDIPD